MAATRKASKKSARKPAKARKAKPARAARGNKKAAKSVTKRAAKAVRPKAKPARKTKHTPKKGTKKNVKSTVKKRPARKTADPKPAAKVDDEVHAPSHSAPVIQPTPLPAPSQVLPVRKAGEEAPKPGAGGRTFEDEDELEEFDPLFDEVREEKD